jgi:hypothetical protein
MLCRSLVSAYSTGGRLATVKTTSRLASREPYGVQLSQARFVVARGKNREHIDDAIATRESNSDGKVIS